MTFIECDSCRSKPGSPQLCSGCLVNRRRIEELESLLRSAVPGIRYLAKIANDADPGVNAALWNEWEQKVQSSLRAQ